MKTISLVYISLSGNTESFVTRLKDYLLSQYEGIEVQKIHIKDLVKEGQDFYETKACKMVSQSLLQCLIRLAI